MTAVGIMLACATVIQKSVAHLRETNRVRVGEFLGEFLPFKLRFSASGRYCILRYDGP